MNQTQMTINMRIHQRQSGLSLTELLVVIAIMAILMSVSIPAAKQLVNSFESSTSVRHLINAALSNARAIAIREQAYAGIRFQKGTDDKMYMIFIVHDPTATGLASGFRAAQGRKPMPLPEDTGIWGSTTTVIFSPQGKLTTHSVRCWNKDGVSDDNSNDTIFNTWFNVSSGKSQFRQDFGSTTSVQNITIVNKEGISETQYINPYTGELVIEYEK